MNCEMGRAPGSGYKAHTGAPWLRSMDGDARDRGSGRADAVAGEYGRRPIPSLRVIGGSVLGPRDSSQRWACQPCCSPLGSQGRVSSPSPSRDRSLRLGRMLACTARPPLVVFGLEISRDELATPLLCSKSRVDAVRMRRGRLAAYAPPVPSRRQA
jgi:hypothetical protein